ncbi:hypothetical protein K469DRAFT_706143, partial [Zopfia rhizophila CBS 207.26]
MKQLLRQNRQKLAQQDARISSLERNNSYLLRRLGEVYNRLDSFESNTEETENITGRDRTDQGDEQGKAKNTATRLKRKK